MVCSAVQYSDSVMCERCGLGWDVNDPAPPECKVHTHPGQGVPFMFSPRSGEALSGGGCLAAEYRKFWSTHVWFYNPWTGEPRDHRYIGSDPYGLLIVPPGEGLAAAPVNAAEEAPPAKPAYASVPLEYVEHPLFDVLMLAIQQATKGKGQRHGGDVTPFLEQQWVALANSHGLGFLTGQAAKKLNEAAAKALDGAFETDPYVREVVGAIVYAGMALLKVQGKA